MVYVKENKFVFYKYKITYRVKTTNELNTVYTDNKEAIIASLEKNRLHYTLENIEELKLGITEYEKLKEMNDLIKQYKENYINDVTLYIENDIVINKDPILEDIFNKCLDKTKLYLLNVLKPYIKNIRTEYENSGFEFKGHIYDTDDRARTSLLGVSAAINTDITINKLTAEEALAKLVPWRMQNNETVMLTALELQEAGSKITKYISTCFAAEKLTQDRIMKLEVRDILNFKELNKFKSLLKNRVDETELTIKDIYSETLNSLIQKV